MAQIEHLFTALRDRGGSDLHLSAGKPPAYRDAGHIEALPGESVLENGALRAMLRELVSEEQWRAFESEHDLDFAYALQGVGRFRGNYLEQQHGVAAVFRMIPEQVIPVEQLGLPPAV